jgi:Xaa-Pro aminopeptidase
MPHYKTSNVPLKKGDIVLLDIGVTLNHYHSDMTRTVFFGPPQKELAKIYEITKLAKEAALKLTKPGVKIKALDEAARSHIEKKGYGDKFSHGLGHGVGLEVHEAPSVNGKSKAILEEGMVITVEPGIYLPKLGGVRLEDTVVVTKSGYQSLTNRPEDLIVI